MDEYIKKEDALKIVFDHALEPDIAYNKIRYLPAADVVHVTEIKKIIDDFQEQADLYTQRAKEILNEDEDTVPKYSWAISLRETYRRTVNALEILIK